MELKCKINGEEVTLRAEPTARLRDVLYRAGYRSVRDSDDAEGFAGSDTIVFNGKLKYANFILFYQAEGAEIRTAESLLNGRELNDVQKAMVAAGIVQSAYNAPAAALILTWLLERKPNPTREEIKDVLTSIFIRDAGYEHYYVGTVEAEPSLDDVLAKVQEGEYTRVVLMPLMIVAGDHANNDMAGDEEGSWKTTFEAAGYEVVPVVRGLGEFEGIQQLLVQHAQEAVDSLH